MSISTKVLIRMGKQWCPVGTASVVDDDASGIRMLRLDLSAMAPQVFVPLRDVLTDDDDVPPADEDELAVIPPCVGHA